MFKGRGVKKTSPSPDRAPDCKNSLPAYLATAQTHILPYLRANSVNKRGIPPIN